MGDVIYGWPLIYFYQSCFLNPPIFQPKHEFVSRYPYLVPYSNIFLDNTDHVISLWNIENSWSIFLESTLVDCLPNLHLHIPIQIQILLMLNHLEKNSSRGYYQKFKQQPRLLSKIQIITAAFIGMFLTCRRSHQY